MEQCPLCQGFFLLNQLEKHVEEELAAQAANTQASRSLCSAAALCERCGRNIPLAELDSHLLAHELDEPGAAVATAADSASGTPASIDLSWQPDTDADLAGYEVYRREDATPWRRISGSQPIVGPAFHDAQVVPGHSYRYGVSAVDQGGRESSRSDEAQETVPEN